MFSQHHHTTFEVPSQLFPKVLWYLRPPRYYIDHFNIPSPSISRFPRDSLSSRLYLPVSTCALLFSSLFFHRDLPFLLPHHHRHCTCQTCTPFRRRVRVRVEVDPSSAIFDHGFNVWGHCKRHRRLLQLFPAYAWMRLPFPSRRFLSAFAFFFLSLPEPIRLIGPSFFACVFFSSLVSQFRWRVAFR